MTAANRSARRQLSQAEIQNLENLSERGAKRPDQSAGEGQAAQEQEQGASPARAARRGRARTRFSPCPSPRSWCAPRLSIRASRPLRPSDASSRPTSGTHADDDADTRFPPRSAQHEVIVCNLGSTSSIGAGSLYVFDKHLAYHNPAVSTFMGLATRASPSRCSSPFATCARSRPRRSISPPRRRRHDEKRRSALVGRHVFPPPSPAPSATSSSAPGARRKSRAAARTQAVNAAAANPRRARHEGRRHP